ncbi:hypothetical protein HRUBRA_00354 [Pseudohaliea rubra DSM 19751]|uniref:DUF7939 domain-containing protein n=1 Tax=Pseudohaliea rubra DSM 19751 TaxID=1265313 RepID=A0A095VUP3_9GAMM|nr:hypothetical protein HRUBRA_00354 [Pseudohaliea rubra DSM 19751]
MWLRTLPGAQKNSALLAQARALGGEELAAALAALDAALYGRGADLWDPAALDAAARMTRRRHGAGSGTADEDSALPPLYPTG